MPAASNKQQTRERLVRLRVAGFRGVADQFELSFPDRRSLVVFAANGNGKSTIADALEWYFTGRVESLQRENRAIRIQHVKATKPTLVEVQTTGLLGGSASYPHPGSSAATMAGTRELFLLRGRDLAEFVDMTKMDKWKSLAKLLGFADMDRLRADLQTVMHELEKSAMSTRIASEAAAAALATTGPSAASEDVFNWLQVKCKQAGISLPSSLEGALDPAWQPTPETTVVTASAQKTTLVGDLTTLAAPTLSYDSLKEWNEVVAGDAAQDRTKRDLFQAAQRHLIVRQEDHCPLCGRPISSEELTERVNRTLAELAALSERLRHAEDALAQLTGVVQGAHQTRVQLARTAKRLGVILTTLPESPEVALNRSREEQLAIDPTIVTNYEAELTSWDKAARAAGATLRIQLADLGVSAIAKIVAVRDSARRWRELMREAEVAERASQVAKATHNAYDVAFRSHLQRVLGRISGRVGDLYAKLHPDESIAGVTVETLAQKGVELAVDFHGIRQRPPNGVLSESHLDSLGLALFLAMAEAANEQLGFLVLDDPISSLDSTHRGTLAGLLVDEFADRQVIVLTHDWLFFERLAKAGWHRLELVSWSFTSGPVARDRDPAMLGRARMDLDAADMEGAGNKGRQALEELLKEICEAVKAPLAYRRGSANDQRMADELISGLLRALKGPARTIRDDIEPLLKKLTVDLSAALNVESHDSVHRVSSKEMELALVRISELDDYFQCATCNTRVWKFGTIESFRCKCGVKTLSLEAPPMQTGTTA